jgi:hypothetical protein
VTARFATPREVAVWQEQLEPLEENRRVAVIRLLAEAVAECTVCGRPVRRCDRRVLLEGRLLHIACRKEARR